MRRNCSPKRPAHLPSKEGQSAPSTFACPEPSFSVLAASRQRTALFVSWVGPPERHRSPAARRNVDSRSPSGPIEASASVFDSPGTFRTPGRWLTSPAGLPRIMPQVLLNNQQGCMLNRAVAGERRYSSRQSASIPVDHSEEGGADPSRTSRSSTSRERVEAAPSAGETPLQSQDPKVALATSLLATREEVACGRL